MRITFRNLEKSELAKNAVLNRFEQTLEKFPNLKGEHITVDLSMDNSPFQAGPDLFRVRARVTRGRYAGLILEKTAPNLYSALADLTDHLLERLNRFGDRERVRDRREARKFTAQ